MTPILTGERPGWVTRMTAVDQGYGQARNLTVSRFDRQPSEYHAFLLRIWRVDARQDWHASLQNTETGQRSHFRTLDELFGFLHSRLDADEGKRRPNPRPP
jgi:hypothetical protein